MTSTNRNVWAVVPAGGIGQRMGLTTPKQHALIAGKSVLAHSLGALSGCDFLRGIVLGLAPDDVVGQECAGGYPLVCGIAKGGPQRANTVINCLDKLLGNAHPKDWVLVHDAARPLVRPDQIENLVNQVWRVGADGGLLGIRVSDTLKRTAKRNRVAGTIERDALWHAQTPQFFRIIELYNALQVSLENSSIVSDDSSAMEAAGFDVLMVQGDQSNIKITYPGDLSFAESILQQRGESKCSE